MISLFHIRIRGLLYVVNSLRNIVILLSAEIDDFKTQRGDMLQSLTAQTEATNNFRSELQQFGSQLGAIFNGMEQRNNEVSSSWWSMLVLP